MRCLDCGYLTLAQGAPGAYRALFELRKRDRDKIKNCEWNDPAYHLTCTRFVWTGNIVDIAELSKYRRCKLCFKYNPGYPASEHLVLQKEAHDRRITLLGMLASAIIGATAAIIANIVTK